MGEFESGKDACITSSVMLAVPTHFFIRPPAHVSLSHPLLQYLLSHLKELCFLFGWQASLQQSLVDWCMFPLTVSKL